MKTIKLNEPYKEILYKNYSTAFTSRGKVIWGCVGASNFREWAKLSILFPTYPSYLTP